MKVSFSSIGVAMVVLATAFQYFNDRSVHRQTWMDFKASDVYEREMNSRLKKRKRDAVAVAVMKRNESSSSLEENLSKKASKRKMKREGRKRTKEDEKRAVKDIERELKLQLVDQGVLKTPDWKDLLVVVFAKWAQEKLVIWGKRVSEKAKIKKKKSIVYTI